MVAIGPNVSVVSLTSTLDEPVLQPVSTCAWPSVIVIDASESTRLAVTASFATVPETTHVVPSSGTGCTVARVTVVSDPVRVRVSPSRAISGPLARNSLSQGSWAISASSHAIIVEANCSDLEGAVDDRSRRSSCCSRR